MSTVRIKYRPSTREGMKGTIYYQIIHKRMARRIKTSYCIFKKEWDNAKNRIIIPAGTGRETVLLSIKKGTARDIKRLYAIIARLENDADGFTADDIVSQFQKTADGQSFFRFMENTITRLKQLGKTRTSETYTSTMNSFQRFLNNQTFGDDNHGCNDTDIFFDEMDSDMMQAYEAHLKREGLSPNTSSFYMRNLRAVYNRAVEKDLTIQRFPFKHVYTGVEKTAKRAVSLKTIKQIRKMDLSGNPTLDFARDIFLFSFYTRGMAFVDIAYMQKNDLQDGILSYRRRKTRQRLFVKWEKCMQEITDKYYTKASAYLLPIIRPGNGMDERKQYLNMAHNVNRSLKIIGRQLGLSMPLTMYVARHTWASIARNKRIPLSVISEGMGHDSEATTRIYLASLDTMAVDNANSLILKSLR